MVDTGFAEATGLDERNRSSVRIPSSLTLIIFCRLELNLFRLTSSVSECVPTSDSLPDSVMAVDEVRRSLLDEIDAASDSLEHVQIDSVEHEGTKQHRDFCSCCAQM